MTQRSAPRDVLWWQRVIAALPGDTLVTHFEWIDAARLLIFVRVHDTTATVLSKMTGEIQVIEQHRSARRAARRLRDFARRRLPLGPATPCPPAGPL